MRIGAQVSYRDLAGFGRRAMDVPPDELADEVAYQIGALEVFARAAGSKVSYVKPHGALYNRTVHDAGQAGAVVAGIRLAAGARGLPVLGLPGSLLLAAASEAGLPPYRRPSPTGPTPPPGPSYRAGSPGPCCTIRTRWSRGRYGWPPRAR